MANRSYVLRGGDDGADRLRVLANVHGPATEALLMRLPLPPAPRCLDVGCGIGEVSMLLARRLPGARVVGVELDATFVSIARAEAARRELSVDIRQLAAEAIEPDASFDLVYARCLLSHLPGRGAVLERMIGAARPGGIVVLEDIDFSGAFCHPPCAAFDRYVALYRDAVQRRGGDPTLGRALASMLAARGLAGIAVDVVQPAFVSGDGKALARTTLEHMRDALVGERLSTHAEIDALAAELASFERAPGTLVAMPRVVQAWASRT